MRQAPRANEYRDRWCGDLTDADAGTDVRVAGWVHRRRDHGGLIFIDLRDRSGLVQLVFHPDTSGEAFAIAEALRSEHVLSARGQVVRREEQNVNPNIPTGQIEISVGAADRLAESETPPFPLDEDVDVDELLRLRHRALDLRRESMQHALELRSRAVSTMRRALEDRDFLEIETPVLGKSTPEGARDFLVPNRRDPGTWYALPQSPQLYKQLLMMSGFERYFQIARCFRDEDLRADRQPEFTQLDIEMAFVSEEDVIGLTEAVMSEVLALGDLGLPAPPWERMGYDEAMARFGSDRPDRRFGLEIVDVSDHVRTTEFKVFSAVLDDPEGAVLAINVGTQEMSRKDLDGLNDVVKRHGGKAVAWAFVEEGGTWRSPIAKFLSETNVSDVTAAVGASSGELILFVADARKVAQGALGGLRLELADRFGLRTGEHDILWVVDFPMVEWNADEQRWDALHHPFTAPSGDLDDPGALRSRAYDLVLDGTELGGGSIRINTAEVQERILELLGMDPEQAREGFGFLLDMLRHGAPPHGGIAFGVDRVVAIMAGVDSIREVIAFPKTASGADPMTGAPSAVGQRQLRELGVRVG